MENLERYKRFDFLDQRVIQLHHMLRRERYSFLYPPKKASIIVSTNKLIYQDNIFKNYRQQNYSNKELIIILNNNELISQSWIDRSTELQLENVQIFQLDESTPLGECLNFAIEKSTGDFIAKFDDDDYYAPQYLIDLIHAFDYTSAALVGKASQFVYFENSGTFMLCHPERSYQYTKNYCGGALVIKREVFDHLKFRSVDRGEDTYLLEDCLKGGWKHYSADPFNYMIFRRANKKHHTWKIKDSEYKNWGIHITAHSPRDFVMI